MWGWMDSWGSGWMWAGGVLMVLFWVAVIILVVWGITRITAHGGTPASRNSPLDIARERYAKGEITKEQFEQLKKDLS